MTHLSPLTLLRSKSSVIKGTTKIQGGKEESKEHTPTSINPKDMHKTSNRSKRSTIKEQ